MALARGLQTWRVSNWKLRAKVVNFKGSSRQQNIYIMGLPESIEEVCLTNYFPSSV